MLDGFKQFSFEGPLEAGNRRAFDVYVKGAGKPVLLLQELPGISEGTLALVDRLNAAGYKVYMPHLVGKLNKYHPKINFAKIIFCMRREIHMFAQFKSSPIANWMHALTREIKTKEDGQGCAVIGMCLTGNFALALMASDAVVGGVACQPALPIKKDVGLHMSPKDIMGARQGMKSKGGAMVLSYDADKLCPAARIKEIDSTFKPFVDITTFEGIHHSTLTRDYGDGVQDRAFDLLKQYLSDRFAQAAP